MGTIVLCDVAHYDRGKWSVLGAGWSRCSAERDTIWTFSMIQMPGDTESHELELKVRIYDADAFATEDREELASAVVQGQFVVETGKRVPPSVTLQIGIPATLRLQPDSAYIVELSCNGSPVAWETFETAEKDELLT